MNSLLGKLFSLKTESGHFLRSAFGLQVAHSGRSQVFVLPSKNMESSQFDMKFIVIFGPQAVGKMTVGVELAKLTGLKLLHNHMTIDLVLNFFDWGTPQFKLSSEFRQRIFEEVSQSELDGLIFTYVWALENPDDKKYIDDISALFTSRGASTYFVELTTSLEERLKRNTSEFRLSQKPPKRDTVRSRQLLLDSLEKHKLNTDEDFFYSENFLKIDNTNKTAADTALQIMNEFGLGK